MDADDDPLRLAVVDATKVGPLANAIRAIDVEPGVHEDDQESVRVSLLVQLPDRNVDAELENLLERIEEAVAAVDHRYASVRFLDAA